MFGLFSYTLIRISGFEHQAVSVFEAPASGLLSAASVGAFGSDYFHWTMGHHNYQPSTE